MSWHQDASKRIMQAIEVAERYGSIDGEHHKVWVIDQMIRRMLGEKQYASWVKNVNSDAEYPPWNEGIAP